MTEYNSLKYVSRCVQKLSEAIDRGV